MNKFITSVLLIGSSLLTFASERNSHLWLNNVPVVADSSAMKMYITLDPESSSALTGTFRWDSDVYSSVALNGTALASDSSNFNVADWSAQATNTLTLDEKEWTLVFSTLPFVLIEANQADLYNVWKEDNDKKSPSTIAVIDARARTKDKKEQLNYFFSNIKIRVRGATSAGKEKKGFAITLKDELGEDKKAHILGYRDDDSWILDAMFNDFSKMRNRVLFDLWNAVDDLPYEKDNDYQCNGTQGEFVEVFMEGKYWGLYCLTDKIDRKKLNLKKTKVDSVTNAETIRGLLWKSTFNCSATTFYNYDKYPTNDTLVWEKYWEQKYPESRQDQAYFNPIADMIDKMKEAGKSSKCISALDETFYIDNIIDYIIFVQAFQLMDNLQKNMYLSVLNKESKSKLLYTPWDLDASLGRDAGGDPLNTDTKWMAFGSQLGGINYIPWVTTHYRTQEFTNKFYNRWQYLKNNEWSLDNVRKRLTDYAETFNKSGVWDREFELAKELRSAGKKPKQANTPEEEIEYIMEFLTRNYAAFDKEVNTWGADSTVVIPEDTTTVTPGGNPVVNPTDTTTVIPGGNPVIIPTDTTVTPGVDPVLPLDSTKTYPEIATPTPAKAIYVLTNGTSITVEGGKGNSTSVSGSVYREAVESISSINHEGVIMSVNHNDGSIAEYNVNSVKEVVTKNGDFYTLNTFIPEKYKNEMAFDARYAPVGSNGTIPAVADDFKAEHTLKIVYSDNTATIEGDTTGLAIEINADQVTITTALTGTEFIITGSSDNGSLIINGSSICKVSVAKDDVAKIARITASCDIDLNSDGMLQLVNIADKTTAISAPNLYIKNGALNIYTAGLHAKGIATTGNLYIYGGYTYIVNTGEGEDSDNGFSDDYPHSIYAGGDVSVKDGLLHIKSVGQYTGCGIGAVGDFTQDNGSVKMITFDDPIHVKNIKVNGGTLFVSSPIDDGIDASANRVFKGGIITVFAMEDPFDYSSGQFEASDCDLVAIGPRRRNNNNGKYRTFEAPKSGTNGTLCYPASDNTTESGAGVKKYVLVTDANGAAVLSFETPALENSALFVSSSKLTKSQAYVMSTSEDGKTYTKLADIIAK